MAVDYDVVIIGGSLAGRYAAITAAQLKARVALVEPPESEEVLARSPFLNLLTPHTLTHVGKLLQQLENAHNCGIHFSHNDTQMLVQWADVIAWNHIVASNLEEQYSLPVLASLGIDIINGRGQFQPKSRLAFTVNQRTILARSYLIATGSIPIIPEIEGLQTTGYITPAQVWLPLTAQKLPQRWVILGGNPQGCQLAQILARLGLKVVLVLKQPQILAQEDSEIAQLVQAILEAEGVRVLTGTTVTQVKRIESHKWVQAGNEAIETDEIVLCAGQQSDVADLNLEVAGVKIHRRRLLLNQKLQTTNPCIYACGDGISSNQFTNIANYEAKIALKNALFFPLFKVDYQSIPWAIFSDPPLARVGLTATQAIQIYGDDVLILRQYFKTVTAAQLKDETTGIFKLVVLRNGKILGAAIVGADAGELINLLSLAIAQKLKVNALTKLAPIYPSFAEIFARIVVEYRQAKLNLNPVLQNLLEGFFNLRRS